MIDISNPRAATVVSSVEFPTGRPYEMIVVGDKLYASVPDGGVGIADITDPLAPVSLGRLEVPAEGMDVVGNRAFVSGGYTRYPLLVFDFIYNVED